MILDEPTIFEGDLKKAKRIKHIKTINHFDDILLRTTLDQSNTIVVEILPKPVNEGENNDDKN